MFGCKKNPDKIVAMASLLILGGVVPLAVALVAQFGFGLHPCHFCLLERYPYLLPIVAGIGTLLTPRMSLVWRLCVAVGIMGWLATGLLGLVHSGIEQGWLHYTGGCVVQAATDHSIEALRAQILAAPIVACNDITAAFLGLSMATWNAVGAFALIALALLQMRFEHQRLRG